MASVIIYAAVSMADHHDALFYVRLKVRDRAGEKRHVDTEVLGKEGRRSETEKRREKERREEKRYM
jgi:hypothetical protein